jgi:hypothetical protein
VAIQAKKNETRSWATKYRGPLAIHASARMTNKQKDLCWLKPFFDPLYDADLIDVNIDNFPLGAVIATCNLVDCLKIRDLRPVKRDGNIVQVAFLEAKNSLIEVMGDELAFGDYTPDRFAWMLEDVKQIEPVPAKGKLGLWEWEGDAK